MSILFLLASLGVVNGFVVSMYLILKRTKSVAYLYFGGLLFVLSIRIGKSIMYYFDRGTDKLVLQIGLSFCVFIGPFFYLYLKSIRKNISHVVKRDIWVLVLLGTAIILVGLSFPYRTYPNLWNEYVVKGIYAVWISYTIAGLIELNLVRRNLGESRASRFDLNYLNLIVLAFLFITITYQLALWVKFTYIWGALIFTISFYYLLARVILKDQSIIPKTTREPIPDAKDILKKIEQILEEKKLFKNPKLKLDELAWEANLTRHQLSRIMNETEAGGFANYIRKFRVEEAKSLIKTRDDLTLEGIGFEAGFNSKSAFYEGFKKVMDQTPSTFKKSLNQITSPE